MSAIPERLAWAVSLVDPRPGERILEIGCGRGLAVRLVGEAGASVLGVDRSAGAIAAAEAHCAPLVAAGLARFRGAPMEAIDVKGEAFDKAFAVNLNAFWREPLPILAATRAALSDGGRLWLVYEPPSSTKAAEIRARLTERLADAGLAARLATAHTASGAPLLAAEVGT